MPVERSRRTNFQVTNCIHLDCASTTGQESIAPPLSAKISVLSGASARRAQSKDRDPSYRLYPSCLRFNCGAGKHCPSVQRESIRPERSERSRRTGIQKIDGLHLECASTTGQESIAGAFSARLGSQRGGTWCNQPHRAGFFHGGCAGMDAEP